TGAPVLTIKSERKLPFISATYDPSGARIATDTPDGNVELWDARSGAALRTSAQKDVGPPVFDPSGTRVASPVRQILRVWDPATAATLLELVGHVGAVTYHPAWSPDGQLLVTGATDGTARLWDATDGNLLAIIPHGQQVWSTSFSPDGKHIATSAED